MAVGPLENKLAALDGMRRRQKPEQVGKGRPPLRPCPPDFDTIFVEIGRVDCETYYRAARITIDRWLLERGKDKLIELRAAFVEHQRAKIRKGKEPKQAAAQLQPPPDAVKVSTCLAQLAANYLRKSRHGGWMITRTLEGNYRTGFTLRSPAQLLDLAISRGFDVELASQECDISDRLPDAPAVCSVCSFSVVAHHPECPARRVNQ